MNYINSSTTMLKETVQNLFSINRSLATAISKWVSSATATTFLQSASFRSDPFVNDPEKVLPDSDCINAG